MKRKSNPVRMLIENSLSFRAGDMVELGNRIGVCKRTVDSTIRELLDEAAIVRVGRGLYVNSLFSEREPVLALAHIAETYQSGGRLSLYSTISSMDGSKSAKDNNVFLVVPSGRCGVLETDFGNIHFHQVSGKVMKSIVNTFGDRSIIKDHHYSFNGVDFTIPAHTPNMGMAVCSYLAACGEKARFNRDSAASIGIDSSLVDWKMVARIAEVANVNVQHVVDIKHQVEFLTTVSEIEKRVASNSTERTSTDSPSP